MASLRSSTSTVSVLDPFNILLNDICFSLTPENLRSLITICGTYITERDRAGIHDASDVFRILKHCNVISNEKAYVLLHIVQKIRPRRKDLTLRVVEYLKVHEMNDWRDFQDSQSQISSRPALQDVEMLEPSPCCSVRCCCCNCEWYRLTPSNLICILVFTTFLTIISVVVWYADIPGLSTYLDKHLDLLALGKYVVGFLTLVDVALLLYIVIRRCIVIYRSHSITHSEERHPIVNNSWEPPRASGIHPINSLPTFADRSASVFTAGPSRSFTEPVLVSPSSCSPNSSLPSFEGQQEDLKRGLGAMYLPTDSE